MTTQQEKKIFVIDTNVLVHDPESILQFPNHKIIIPLAVLEQLNSLKKLHDERGKNARNVIRLLDILQNQCKGNVHDGLQLENKSTLSICLDIKQENDRNIPSSIQQDKTVMSAYHLSKSHKNVIIVSKDLASRIRAKSIGIKTEDYVKFKASYNSLYSGIRKIDADKSIIDKLFKDGTVESPVTDLQPNEYAILQCPERSTIIGKYDQKNNTLSSLIKLKSPIWGIEPLNQEQRCTVDLLLRDDINLVTLVGPAGTGKTLLSLACGLRKVFDEGIYNRVLVSRPIVPLGKDIGFLPGYKEEKLYHWMQPIYDNLELLCASTESEDADNDTKESIKWILESKKFEMEAVTYIRGRSLPKIYMIIDEAQNLTIHEIKTIISRAGHHTKVILTGDPTQIDNPYLDRDTNGLIATIEKFKNHPIFGHITLTQTERSKLAALAADIM